MANSDGDLQQSAFNAERKHARPPDGYEPSNTWASQNEYVYGVPRVIPTQRTYRALTAANVVIFQPAAEFDTDATSVNDTPSNDTWNLYDDAYAASQFNATRSTCRTDPRSTCHH
jgi:hypothetical protein